MELFPDKQYVLIGDNTQHDLTIYLEVAKKYPINIRYIIIRQVFEKLADKLLIKNAEPMLTKHKIGLHYDSHFPDDIPWEMQQ